MTMFDEERLTAIADEEEDRDASHDAPPPVGADDGSVDFTWARTGGKFRSLFETVGEIFSFTGDTFRALPKLRLYPTEVIRQTALLILGSGLIIWLMEGVMGLECGTEASYILKQVGAPIYSGVFDSWCAVRECAPYMWGYILSAKVGCGLVAEIGSMRISEEIDVLEVMGIRPMGFIVASRLAAVWLAVPFLYAVALGVMFLTEYVVTVVQLHTVSSGGYLFIFWLFQNPLDLFFSFIKVFVESTVIVLIGCYYGYTARGGSVGVGKNTAKSMIANMVMVHLIGMLGTMIFWGQAPRSPIGN
jgi:phospholipid/cholesterol/gamma-HCH transport system permease protein